MGVRIIGYRFTGDWSSLRKTQAEVEASQDKLKKQAAEVGDATAGGAKKGADATKAAADTTAAAVSKVEAAQKRAASAAEALTAAQKTSTDAAKASALAQEKAALSAAAAKDKTLSSTARAAAEQTAIVDAAAAQQAAAQLKVAKAAEQAAAREVTAAKRAAAEQVSAARTATREAEQASTKRARASTELGTALLGVGVATGAGVAVAVKSFADFDVAISKARAATGATGDELETLRAAAIQYGAATQYSATEAADAITAMSKAGVSTSAILGGGLKGALDLAAAGQLQVADSAEIAATAMTQFGLSGAQLPHVADLLAAGAGKAQGEVTDMANALKYVGPVAHGVGVSIEETVGSIAELASQGIIGEQAGTSLRGVLSSLTAPSKQAQKTMDEYGISVRDANGEFIGFAGAAQELKDKLGPLGAAQRDAALKTIFGNEQLTAARILYQGGAKDVLQWTAAVNDQGFASKQAADLTDNLRGDIERLGGSLSSVFITGGSGANDALRGIVKSTQGAVDTFGSLPAPVQQGAVALGGVVSAATLAGGAMLILVPKIADTIEALKDLGVTSEESKGKLAAVGKISGIVAAYAAVNQVVGTLGPRIEDDANSVQHLTTALQHFQTGVDVQDVGALGKNFGDLGQQLHGLANPNFLQRSSDVTAAIFKVATLGGVGSFQGDDARRLLLADLNNLDTALTQMVQSGNADEAKDMFDNLNAESRAAGNGVDQLAKHLPNYTAAQQAADDAAKQATAANADYTRGVQDASAAAVDAAKKVGEFNKALIEGGEAVLGQRQAIRDHIQALVDLKKAITQGGDASNNNTKANRDAATALDAYAENSLKTAKAIFSATGDNEAFRKSIIESRKNLYQAALQLGLTRKEAADYVDQVLKIPPRAETDIKADVSKARNDVKDLTDKLKKVPRDQRTKVSADLRQAKAQLATYLLQLQEATGKTYIFYTKQETLDSAKSQDAALARRAPAKRAAGGLIPRHLGGPTQDNVPVLASGGEWFIRAAAVDHYGDAFMAAINSMSLPRFADGGPVSAASALAQAVAAVPAPSVPQSAAATVIRVPVSESHSRTVSTGAVHFHAANERTYRSWVDDMQRRAERLYS